MTGHLLSLVNTQPSTLLSWLRLLKSYIRPLLTDGIAYLAS